MVVFLESAEFQFSDLDHTFFLKLYILVRFIDCNLENISYLGLLSN